MITEELIEEVYKEATALRQEATAEEIGRLDFDQLVPRNTDLCIYGQMTGSCWSPRASRLLERCAIPFAKDVRDDDEGEDILPPGEREEGFKRSTFSARFSPIEYYICQEGANIEALVAYLKGGEGELEL